jgi:hypothetical protein
VIGLNPPAFQDVHTMQRSEARADFPAGEEGVIDVHTMQRPEARGQRPDVKGQMTLTRRSE